MTSTPSRNFEMRQGDDRTLRLPVTSDQTLNTPVSPSAQIEWWMCSGPAPDPDNLRVRRVRGDDLVLEQEAGVWVVKVRLHEEDTVGLAAGEYYHECRIDDPTEGARTIVFGILTLRPSAIAQGLADPDMMLPPPYTSSAARRAEEAADRAEEAVAELDQDVGALVVSINAAATEGVEAIGAARTLAEQSIAGSVTTASNAQIAAVNAAGAATTLLNSASGLALTVAAQASAAQQSAANAQAISQSNLAGVAKGQTVETNIVVSLVASCARDTDGGSWRHKLAARFPQSFQLIGPATQLRVVDLDDPATPVWRAYTVVGMTFAEYLGQGLIGYGATGGFYTIDLIADQVVRRSTAGFEVCSNQTAATFNQSTATWALVTSAGALPSNTVNSATAIILPHTPRDPQRCDLPRPTIVLSTALGACTIRADRSAINSATTSATTLAVFDENRNLWLAATGGFFRIAYPNYLVASFAFGTAVNSGTFAAAEFATPFAQNNRTGMFAGRAGRYIAHRDNLNCGGGVGLMLPDMHFTARSLLAVISQYRNTGFMIGGGGRLLAFAESALSLSNLTDQTVLNEDFATTAGWTISGAALVTSTFVASGNVLTFTTGAGETGARQWTKELTGLVVGDTYVVTTQTPIGGTSTDIRLAVRTALNGIVSFEAFKAGAAQTYAFVATATTMVVQISTNGGVAGSTSIWYPFTVRRCIADLTLRGHHGVINGTLARRAVATGAELAEIGGYSAANFIQTPYSSAFDFGTGDFSFGPFWVTDDGVSSVQTIAERAHYTAGAYSGPRITLFKDSTRFSMTVHDGTTPVTVNGTTFTPTADRRYLVAGVRNGANIEMYVNGVRQASASVAGLGTLNNASATLVIGRTHAANATASPFGGWIALPRISSVPLAFDQAQFIFAQESKLFMPDAKCLLLGSSIVNSVNYDPEADRIYAATAIGTNVLNNLLRVGYLQSTLAANRVNAEATVTGTGTTSVTRADTGGPANWGVDRYLWALTENAATSNHLAAFPASTLTAAPWVLAVPVLVGSRGWAAIRLSGGTNPILNINLATGANGTAAGGATALPPVNMGGGLWLAQFTFTGTAVAYTPQILAASADNTISYAGNNGAGGAALSFGKPMLVQRSTALTAADYQHALSGSDNHASVSVNDNNVSVRTAAGVDLWMPAIPLRERSTARRGVAPYDPTTGEHRGSTIDATPTNLCTIALREGKSYQFTAEVLAIQHGALAGDRARYVVRGEVWREPGGDIQIRSATTVEGEVTASMDCIGAVTTGATQAFHIRGTGRASTRLAWVVRFTNWTDSGLSVAA